MSLSSTHPSTFPSLTPVSEATLTTAIAPGTGLVAVDFTADWCAPCRLMKPVLQSLAGEFDGRLRIVTLDADAHPSALVQHGVRGLPTVLVFRDGVIVDRIIGAIPANRFRERIGALTKIGG